MLFALSTQVPTPSLVTPPVVPAGIPTVMMLSCVLVPPRIRLPVVEAPILVMAPLRMTGLANAWLA